MKAPLARYVIIAATGGIFASTSGAPADSAGLSEKSSWLLGNFTQNAPCKGDGSDAAELKVTKSSPRAAFANFSPSPWMVIASRPIWSVIFRPGHSSAMLRLRRRPTAPSMLWTATTTIQLSFIDARSDGGLPIGGRSGFQGVWFNLFAGAGDHPRRRVWRHHPRAMLPLVKQYAVGAGIATAAELDAGYGHMPLSALPLFFAMCLGATLGGNATLLGAAFNVVASGICSRGGKQISFATFMTYGVPATAVQLLVAVLYIGIRMFLLNP